MQIRQDFTKAMINTLQTGADNLTLADTNEEGANLLALQTRQQLSTTALSLASQAEPGRAPAVPVTRRASAARRAAASPSYVPDGVCTRKRHSASQAARRGIAWRSRSSSSPNERILIGECVITNCNQRTWLLIEGAAPILREKDILTPERADTPAKRIYLAVQLMYTSRDPRVHHERLFRAGAPDRAGGAEHLAVHVENINNQILSRRTCIRP